MEFKPEEVRRQRTQVMTLPEVAKYLGLHKMTVYRFVKECKIPATKIGGRWRVKKDILDRWIEEHTNK